MLNNRGLLCVAFMFTEYDVMFLAWQYYHNMLVKSVIPDYALLVFHTEMRKLPWQSFFPTLDVLQNMLEVCCCVHRKFTIYGLGVVVHVFNLIFIS